MGSCISTCRPKKHSLDQEFKHHVQDKLVISQAPKTPNIPHHYSNKISPSPPSPPSSISSLSCTAGSTTAVSSCSSLSSSASSALSSKDRSFSNEFLWSCVKENSHIVRNNSIREKNAILFCPAKVYVQKPNLLSKPMVEPMKHSIPKKIASSTPQKRVRSSSPTPLPRQKSFRREPEAEGSSPSYSVPNRIQRSPSPSRRYNGDRSYGAFLTNTPIESHSKRMVGSRSNRVSSLSSSLRKETLRPASSSNNSSRRRPYMRNREMKIHRVGSKIDEVAVGKAVSDQDMDSIPMEEDIDNPLISLDCFIFL